MDFEKYYRMREEQEKDLKDGEFTSEISKYRAIKITEIVNEYHYNFVSWRRYKINKKKEIVFCIIYIILVILFIILIADIVFRFLGEDIFSYFYVSYVGVLFLVYLFSIFLVLIYRSMIIDYSNLILKKFSYMLNTGRLESNNIKSEKRLFFNGCKNGKSKENIRIIKENWLNEMFPECADRLKISKEIDEWQKLYEKHNNERKIKLTRVVVNKEATVRILSLVIALFSLMTILIVNFASTDVFIEHLKDNFIPLYKELLYLGFSIFFLGYEIYYIFPKIIDYFISYISDFNTDEEKYVKSRFDSFIVFLLNSHKLEIEERDVSVFYQSDNNKLV